MLYLRMMKRFSSFLIFAISLLLLAKCKPEKELLIPEITSFSISNDIIYALDTLHFDLSAYSDSPIRSATLRLTDDSGVTLLSSVVNGLESMVLELKDEWFVLSRKDLAGGNYCLEATVSNEDGVAKEEIVIAINALDPFTAGVFLISHHNEYSTDVALLDDDLNTTSVYSLQGDFLDAAIDCDDDLLFTIGKMSGNLVCYNVEDEMIQWIFQAEHNPPFPYFQALVHSDNMIWIALYHNNILGFDHHGVEKYRAWLTRDRLPVSLLITENYVVAEEYSRTIMKKVLTSWYRASGVVHNPMEAAFDDIVLIDGSNNKILYAGVSGDNTTFFAHDLTMNERRRLFDYSGKIVKACKGSGGCYFLVSENEVLTFCPDYEITHSLALGNIKSISYDHIEKKLWIIADKTLFKYNMQDNVLEKSNTFDATPEKVIIRYNRNLFSSEY